MWKWVMALGFIDLVINGLWTLRYTTSNTFARPPNLSPFEYRNLGYYTDLPCITIPTTLVQSDWKSCSELSGAHNEYLSFFIIPLPLFNNSSLK